MNRPPISHAEQLSALADGELRGPELDTLLQACAEDPALLATWRDHHQVGELLRGQVDELSQAELAFLSRWRAQVQATGGRPLHAQHAYRRDAANAPRFAWRWVAGLASLGLVALMTWTLGLPGSEPELAQVEQPLWVSSPQGLVLRDAALEELMEAHRQQGDASVLPMPSGFLRNAAFEAPPAALSQAPAR